MKRGLFLLLLGLGVSITGCDLDISNPNNPSEEQVQTTREGIISLAVGLQQFYASLVTESSLLTPGVTSREIAANSTFLDLVNLDLGGTSLDPRNAHVFNLWSRCYRAIDMANQLIDNAPKVPMAEGTRSGILALAHMFKAMALGTLAQAFEQLPLDVQADGKAPFRPRAEAFAEAVRHLERANTLLLTTPVSTEFTATILARGLDLRNTILARMARYALMAGVYRNDPALLTKAEEAAAAVDLTKTSVFTYDARTPNPIHNLGVVVGNYAPLDNLGTPLFESGDARLRFWTSPSPRLSTPHRHPIEDFRNFFDAATRPIPLYLPGEMRLIRAEVYVRTGRLSDAVREINAIRTKTAAMDPFGIGAGLPPYGGPVTESALLTEIYRQRAAELFMQGLRLEDSRRLGRPGPPVSSVERNRNFYPYPQSERDNNPNTPPDPPN